MPCLKQGINSEIAKPLTKLEASYCTSYCGCCIFLHVHCIRILLLLSIPRERKKSGGHVREYNRYRAGISGMTSSNCRAVWAVMAFFPFYDAIRRLSVTVSFGATREAPGVIIYPACLVMTTFYQVGFAIINGANGFCFRSRFWPKSRASRSR